MAGRGSARTSRPAAAARRRSSRCCGLLRPLRLVAACCGLLRPVAIRCTCSLASPFAPSSRGSLMRRYCCNCGSLLRRYCTAACRDLLQLIAALRLKATYCSLLRQDTAAELRAEFKRKVRCGLLRLVAACCGLLRRRRRRSEGF